MLSLIATGMSLGISASTSCAAICFPILLPYIASDTNTRLTLGLIIAFIIGSVDISPLLVPLVTLGLSLILIIYGLHTLGAFNFGNGIAVKTCKAVGSKRPHFFMGMLVGSRPCIPLLAALLYTTSLTGFGEVTLFMLFFGIASSLLIITLGVAGRGLINLVVNKIGLERIRRLSGLVLVMMGGVFLLQSIGGLIGT
jgi:hypothetical protein